MNENNEELDKALQEVNTKRRSFTKVGAVAPVILTLANRPAWGGVRTMCSVSGFDSAVVKNPTNQLFSGNVPVNEQCGGVHARGYWATIDSITTPSGFDLNTAFNAVFGGTTNDSFLVVIGGILSRNNDYAGLYVDALEAGLSFPLTVTEVVSLYAGTGVSGNGWTETEGDSFVTYLLNHAV